MISLDQSVKQVIISPKNRNMNSVQVGNLIAIKSVGAYGSVLSSNYNSRPQIAEIIVQNDKYEVIRERVEVKDILAREDSKLVINFLG